MEIAIGKCGSPRVSECGRRRLAAQSKAAAEQSVSYIGLREYFRDPPTMSSLRVNDGVGGTSQS